MSERRFGLLAVLTVTAALSVLATACTSPSPAGTASAPSPSTSSTVTSDATDEVGAGSRPPAPSTPAAPISKVMLIMEENRTYREVLDSGAAPYLAGLADRYGVATSMVAGYPVECPSLAAYIILTSGSDHGICDDDPPARHPITGDSIYSQVSASGRQWRGYAETMAENCVLDNDAAHRYLVRHAPAPYYVKERAHCAQWDAPAGTPSAGTLHDDLVSGALPAYSILTPDACDDMHGGPACDGDPVAVGDAWLSRWVPAIVASPDFTTGRLVVFITWDEGSDTSNHIATLVLSSRTDHVTADAAWNHCSTLRTTEDLLDLPPLGCAAQASSMTRAFNLR